MTSIFNSYGHPWIPTVDLSSAILQQKKINQYADDATLILDGSIVSFTTSLQILDLFREISGLRLNNKKTVALWIGANTEKESNLSPEKDFKWVKDKPTPKPP